MREGTLWLVYICKYIELIYLIVLTILLFIEGIKFMTQVEELPSPHGSIKLQVLIMVPICLFLATLNLIYNNLLTNLRFKFKLNCKTLGMCFYDCFNCAFGFCCLKKFCTDQWCGIPTLIKWTLKAGIFGYTLWTVYEAQEKVGVPPNLVTPLYKKKNDGTFLFILLILHIGQHIAFWVSRPIFFIIWSILTCCCDKGQEFGENETFENCVISYKFIEHETEHRGGMQNHPVGMAEISYYRRMGQVTQEGQQRHNEIVAKKEMSTSMHRALSMKMAGALQ